jgi:CubicO group peptidase (beta-lactamase class C family)
VRRAPPGAAGAAFVAAALALSAPPAGAAIRCADPTGAWERRAPAAVGVSPARLREALAWAARNTGGTVVVVRRGCLVGESRPERAGRRVDGWSMTKSVTAMVAGRAATLGLLDLDRPIAALYPDADAAHGALTPRQLLTMTSGLRADPARDLSPIPDRVRDALSLPFAHPPGTRWEYGQSPVSLLLDAVARAVGRDAQTFANAELFAPLGIPRDAWTWDRDRAGHTEGWAHLRMRPREWARLGQLMLRHGTWGGRRLLSEGWVSQALTRLPVNGGYGMLFWLNGGRSHIVPGARGAVAVPGQVVPAGPRDMFAMAGVREQRVYAFPSRDLAVVRLAERGSAAGRAGRLDHELVRRVLRAVVDMPYRDPGPFGGSRGGLPR